ncbi:MAG TPA: DUF2125 domain-containing protein [Stellaceae bacterium]|nr:DUF2125 domain-containing protein [Stellaceae bacterium]
MAAPCRCEWIFGGLAPYNAITMHRYRRLARPLGIVAVLAIAAYTGLWYWQGSIARERVDAALAKGQVDGLRMTGSKISLGGYPFWVEVKLEDGALSGLSRFPGARITAPLVVFRYHPLTPGKWTLSTPKGLSAELPVGGSTATFSALELTADVGPRQDAASTFNIRAGGITMATNPANSVKLRSIRLRLEVPDKQGPEQHVGFGLALDGVTLPRRMGPLGPVIDLVEFEGQFQGDLPHQRLSVALAAWRDGGGTVELRHAHIGWDRLQLDAQGTAALDHDMQPEAAFTAEVHDWTAALDALVDGGSLEPKAADYAKFGLTLLGGGGGESLKAPIAVQNGQVYVEKAKLAKFPHIDWP